MTKNVDELLEDTDDYDDLSPEDYVFIVGPDGKMKSVIFPPEDEFEYSQGLKEVFSMFGVEDPNLLLGQTIH
jgi:hypothetical protein